MFLLEQRPDVVIYHDPCLDGFGAAWAIWKKFFGKVEYIPGSYHGLQQEKYWLSKVRNKHVVIFDYSFPLPLTKALHAAAKSFQIIDHHASAQAELGHLPYCHFNLNKSGAVLAWEAAHQSPPPPLLEYIQDQDLFRFNLPESRKVGAYISCFERTFDSWSALNQMIGKHIDQVIAAGGHMLAYRQSLVDEIVKHAQVWEVFGYHGIPVVNCPGPLRSFVCEKLMETPVGSAPHIFSGAYTVNGPEVTWSLRTNNDLIHLGKLAAKNVGLLTNGGGHPRAAGFSIPVNNIDFSQRKLRLVSL